MALAPPIAPPPEIAGPPRSERTRLGRYIRRKNRYAEAFLAAGLIRAGDALRLCTTHQVLAGCSHCGKAWYVTSRCRLRVCPICSFKETKRRAAFIERRSQSCTHLRMLTLTLPASSDNPRATIALLHKRWTRLRHRKVMRSVVGGCYQIELKPKPWGWHVHLHAIIESSYIPYQRIWSAWKDICGTRCPQIDIRAADTPAARGYVAKYAAKSAGFDDAGASVVEWYNATHGLRLWGTFGTWFDLELEEKAKDLAEEPPPPPCPFCGACKTTYLVRDGPRVFGPDLWRLVSATLDKDLDPGPTLRPEWADFDLTPDEDEEEQEPCLAL